MAESYDAIVVGARCAGSPTAMLLARKGLKVLLVDRATFPSDTISTHVLQPDGVAAMARWGLLDRLLATGCPPIHTYSYDFGPFEIAGTPGGEAFPVAYCPRRTILDKLLVDAAAEAGAEVREGFAVERLVRDGECVAGIEGHGANGAKSEERASIVIGADGRNGPVARWVEAQAYGEKPRLFAAYYAYWSGLDMGGRFATWIRPARGFASAPTHDGLAFLAVGWPYAEFEANKADIEGEYLRTVELAPELAERLRAARRETPFKGAAVPNYFRKPYGSGWALVGDAGYNRDFITAQGISDAFRDAETLAEAVADALGGARPFDTAMADYQHRRDAQVLPMYEFTCQLATLEPPPPEMQQLFGAITGNRKAEDDFARVNAGTMSPAEFFAAENVEAILAAGAGGGPAAPGPELRA